MGKVPVFVVLGANGRTGVECVKEILRRSHDETDPMYNCKVRAVCRDPSRYNGPQHRMVEVVAGDVTRPEDMKRVMWNTEAAIFAASGKGYWSSYPVDARGALNAANACKNEGTRLVVISSALVSYKNFLHPIRILLNSFRWRLMDAKAHGERLVRASRVDCCVVRPGGLTDGAGKQALVGRQGDWFFRMGTVDRSDLARVCVEAMINSKASRVTMELYAKSKGSNAVSGVFEGMRRDWTGLGWL